MSESNDDRPWTAEYRNREWIFDWSTGVHVYMQALRAAGLPAPSFEYEEEYHEAEEEGKQDMTLRIRLQGPEREREALLAFSEAQEKIYSNPQYPPIGANVLGTVRVAIRDGTYLRWRK